MPAEGVPLSPADHLLSTPEILELSRLFVSQGVNKIRLTGGEPTVRKDILELVQELNKLRPLGLQEIAMTSNGVVLGSGKRLQRMVDAGLNTLNLSLDTLVPAKFEFMTRRKGLQAVLRTIEHARAMGFGTEGTGRKIKINCVVMKNVNDDEILDFVEMTRDIPVEVRFIEYMPFDVRILLPLGFGQAMLTDLG
jgi:cyclic pyranopterin phosphate synthase